MVGRDPSVSERLPLNGKAVPMAKNAPDTKARAGGQMGPRKANLSSL